MAKKKTTDSKKAGEKPAEKAGTKGGILLRLNITETVSYDKEIEITSEQLGEVQQLFEDYHDEDLAEVLMDRFIDKTTDITDATDQEVFDCTFKLPDQAKWERLEESEPCEDLGDSDDDDDDDTELIDDDS
jgi:hypothetical protein